MLSLRKRQRRVLSSKGRPGADSDGMFNRPRNSSAEPNERTSILGHSQSPSRWWDHIDDDERKGARILKKFVRAVYTTLTGSYVNVFLVFVPLGIIAGAVGWDPTAVFVLNFLAIIPLASLLGFATEELAAKLGQTIGGLMNATFGNAVELIVSIVALRNGEIRIVQTSMLGSILSNLLLVLGCCFLYGGYGRLQQKFDTTVASTMSSLMAVASASLVIPATLYGVLDRPKHRSHDDKRESDDKILVLSRGTAMILLILYVMYLYFQLKSHAELFDKDHSMDKGDGQTAARLENGTVGRGEHNHDGNENQHPHDTAGTTLSPPAAAVALIIVTVFVAVCAEYLVDSIDAIVQTAHISKTFIGLILLPIVGNAAEHVTAVIVARKDKMDLAIGVAIGSSLQIALLVTPFLVILGWIIGQPMTLQFEVFETVVFFLSTTVVYYLIQDGASNYLEGAMLLGTREGNRYAIIALAFYVYPDERASQLVL